jgi:hypothetical protein
VGLGLGVGVSVCVGVVVTVGTRVEVGVIVGVFVGAVNIEALHAEENSIPIIIMNERNIILKCFN